MLAMPYGLLGGFGWFVYRGLKANKTIPPGESSEN
jgi:hypothetical protein